MTDARGLPDDALHQLDRLGAVILDDIGDGPAAQDLIARASEVRNAVAQVGIAALNEVTGLIAGVADSMAAGTIDWSPSLGGTLMAAVDDLRTLVSRAAQFSAEDSEHLHQRASELAVYVRVRPGNVAAPVAPPAPPPAAVVDSPPPAAVVDSPSPAVEKRPAAPDDRTVIPISTLFYSEGPQIVSGGVPQAATAKSDILGTGIAALEHLTHEPLAAPTSTGPMIIVPVETLVYRGRAALERAAVIREQIKSSGTSPSPAALDEMYDLIGLALKD